MSSKKVKDITVEMKDAARKIWLAGLGALAAAEEEGGKVFRTLVDRGEDFEKRSRPAVSRTVDTARGKVKEAWGKVGDSFEERVKGVMKRLGVPARGEMERLSREVEKLGSHLRELQGRPVPKKKTATRRPAPRQKKTIS